MKETKQGKIIEAKYCPNCEDKVLVRLKSGEIEIFKCENCKFVIKDKKNKK